MGDSYSVSGMVGAHVAWHVKDKLLWFHVCESCLHLYVNHAAFMQSDCPQFMSSHSFYKLFAIMYVYIQ